MAWTCDCQAMRHVDMMSGERPGIGARVCREFPQVAQRLMGRAFRPFDTVSKNRKDPMDAGVSGSEANGAETRF